VAWLTEERLSKAAVIKAELEAEVSRGRCETASIQEALDKMTAISDGLSQDKIDLNKIITQVHHFYSDGVAPLGSGS